MPDFLCAGTAVSGQPIIRSRPEFSAYSLDDYVGALVSHAPALTDDQRCRISALLHERSPDA